jgi:hypothetical protein
MARAAEERRLGFIMDQVSPRFRSSDGLSKDELKGLLAAHLLGARWLRVFTSRLDVHATAPTQVELYGTYVFGRSTAGSVKELVKDSSFAAERVGAVFEREDDGEWRITTASHQPLSQDELLKSGG